MSTTTKAPLILQVIDSKGEEKDLAAGKITFETHEPDTLILQVRAAAEKAVKDGFEVKGFRLGGERVRYIVDAVYSDNSGTWYEHRDGVCEAEAALHGLMTMVLEEGVDDVFLDKLEAAEGMTVNYCAPEPVTKEEYQTALQAFIAEVRAKGHEGPALDEVVRLLGVDGIEVEETVAPRM